MDLIFRTKFLILGFGKGSMKKTFVFIGLTLLFLLSCKKDKPTPSSQPQPETPKLIFKFRFDSTQARLNNIGQVSTLPANHRAQSPKFNGMCAHYIELASYDTTSLGLGKILYHAPETTAGGATAIDHSQSVIKGDGQEFFSIPLSQVPAGTYKWIRVSLAYQNYDITYKSSLIPGNGLGTGTVASFVGYNTYLNSYKIKNQTIVPSGGAGNRLQGYWGFETTVSGTTTTLDGQAPANATTVPNPLFASSPIPPGSCVVTGQFVNSTGSPQMLTITGSETNSIVVIISLSTNNSFEWKEYAGDNYYEPAAGDTVVDMGIRGLIPFIQ